MLIKNRIIPSYKITTYSKRLTLCIKNLMSCCTFLLVSLVDTEDSNKVFGSTYSILYRLQKNCMELTFNCSLTIFYYSKNADIFCYGQCKNGVSTKCIHNKSCSSFLSWVLNMCQRVFNHVYHKMRIMYSNYHYSLQGAKWEFMINQLFHMVWAIYENSLIHLPYLFVSSTEWFPCMQLHIKKSNFLKQYCKLAWNIS